MVLLNTFMVVITLRPLGLESSVRPSLAFYNSTHEIDTLVAALHDLVGRYDHEQRNPRHYSPQGQRDCQG
jgi:hypothetical protein